MRHRPLSWLLCLLLGIALALLQAAMSAWTHEGGECLAEHAILLDPPDQVHQAEHGDGLNESRDTAACGAPCLVCSSSLYDLASGPAPSHEPRWSVAESLPLRVPDRLERPPRV